VNHGDIPGFMPAMAMPYRVKDPAVVQELQPGDQIAAEIMFGKNPSDYWLEDVRITRQSPRPSTPAVVPKMVLPGERVPDAALINQDAARFTSRISPEGLARHLHLHALSHARFLPRLSSQFAQIHNELKKNPEDYAKTHLLTISFDPKYDTPLVLRKYGLAYLDGDASGFSHWDFATTNPKDLRRLAEAFGLRYEGENDQISHAMDIVLIAPNGTVAQLLVTNWTWTELMASMQNAAHVTAAARKK